MVHIDSFMILGIAVLVLQCFCKANICPQYMRFNLRTNIQITLSWMGNSTYNQQLQILFVGIGIPRNDDRENYFSRLNNERKPPHSSPSNHQKRNKNKKKNTWTNLYRPGMDIASAPSNFNPKSTCGCEIRKNV